MGSVGHIDPAAEGASPACVVETFSAVERHPVIDLRGISLAFQRRVPLLVGDWIDPGMRNGAPRNISGDQVAGNDLLSVFIKIQMLGRQVHLYIGVAVVAVAVSGSHFGKRWSPVDSLTGGQHRKKPVCLLLLVHFPFVDFLLNYLVFLLLLIIHL